MKEKVYSHYNDNCRKHYGNKYTRKFTDRNENTEQRGSIKGWGSEQTEVTLRMVRVNLIEMKVKLV